MTTYQITHRFHATMEIGSYEAETADAAYAQYAADPGDRTNSDDEPFDRDDLAIVAKASDRQIRELRNEAGSASDLVTVHMCSVALDEQEPVTTAAAFEDRYGGGGFDRDEQRKIMSIESQEQAWAECERVIADAAAQRE